LRQKDIGRQGGKMKASLRTPRKDRIGKKVKTLILLSAISLLAVGCNFIFEGTNPIGPEPTKSSPSNTGSISGVIWSDLCDSSSAHEIQSEGCVKPASQNFYHANGIFELGEPGIGGMEVTLGQGVCPAKGFRVVQSGSDGHYRFMDLEDGVYCVSVENAVPHLAKLEPGMWTSPKTTDGQGVGWISVTVKAGNSVEGVNFGWDFLEQTASETPEPTNTPTPAPACIDHVTFIQDITIPDGTSIGEGETFEKVWRLKNSGTCTWTEEYALVFDSGNLSEDWNKVSLSQSVLPGESFDLSIDLKAPQSQGEYEGYWMFENNLGEKFGIGKDGDKPFWTKIRVGIAPSPTAVVSWTPRLDPGEMSGEGRWVDVDLGDQLLTAYEGTNPVMTFLVSSGTSAHPTVMGQFRIWIKLESTRMRGPGYDLEDVPYTMYFYEGYGLHGAYWHNNFGTPMSHGCVNLSPSDAEWLFHFASVGTLVNIHS
jgi:hypothetical protein